VPRGGDILILGNVYRWYTYARISVNPIILPGSTNILEQMYPPPVDLSICTPQVLLEGTVILVLVRVNRGVHISWDMLTLHRLARGYIYPRISLPPYARARYTNPGLHLFGYTGHLKKKSIKTYSIFFAFLFIEYF